MKTQDSMKPVGTWEVRRRIKIPALVHAADAMAVEDAVRALSGVRNMATDVEKHQLIVRYDASQSAYQAIVEALESAGFPPLDNWWCRFKGSWFEFTDTNARDNAHAPPPACCNKPPK
ncbi:heavy-metal-associated domain-containing protein [Candidatus Endoriftia persephone]|jgi:copper chaperone CopZ|nr:heavy-metal-associated domain-containing protein [Candidatus Endoriftia persephone]USF88647.1 heavy-metal-associated domain-containing protein [Candidatus Endoriftia persephone]